MFYETTDLVSI